MRFVRLSQELITIHPLLQKPNLDRSVVHISANLLGDVFRQNSPQNRHPERSASRIYCLTEGLWRAVEEPVPSVAEGTPRMLVGRCASGLSGHQNHKESKKSQPLSGSASRIDRVAQRLMARSRGKPRRCSFAHAVLSFSTTEARSKLSADDCTAAGVGTISG
jgi:hypothetical protein